MSMFLTPFASLRRRKVATTVSTFWSIGLGDLKDYTFMIIGLPLQDPAGLISNTLLANAAQLILSVFYMVYNALLTTFLVQHEFDRMAQEKNRKPLRVSEPVGIQRGSFPISLPMRYGLPQMVGSAVLNWLVSQAFFLARITALYPDGSTDRANSFSTCGYSPIALFLCEWKYQNSAGEIFVLI